MSLEPFSQFRSVFGCLYRVLRAIRCDEDFGIHGCVYYGEAVFVKRMPKGGVEPPCPLGTTDFESVASTGSATSACS